jgi:hypothetical protein
MEWIVDEREQVSALSCINKSNRKYVESFSPFLDDMPIQALKWEDHYRYLGVQEGRTRVSSLKGFERHYYFSSYSCMPFWLLEENYYLHV